MTLADWIKFVPGWLAFVITVGTLIHKWWTRRHKVALGPDDDAVREALTTARSLFKDIIAKSGFTTNWFEDEVRRDTGQRLKDLARRRDDKKLRIAMTDVAESWDRAFANSPPPRFTISSPVRPQDPSARKTRVEDSETRGRQVETATEGLAHIERALIRLDKLERRTFGRS